MEPPIGSSPLPDVASQSHPFQVSDVLRAVRDLAYDLPENEADCNEGYSDVIPPPNQDTCYAAAQLPVFTEEIVTGTSSSPLIMYDMDGYIERTSSRTSYLLPNVRLVTQDTLTIGPSAQPYGALSDSTLNTALDSRLRLLQSQVSRQPQESTSFPSSQERRPKKAVDEMEADVEINVIDSDSDGNHEEDTSYEAESSPTHPQTIPYSELVVYDHDYEIFPGDAGDYNNGLERVPLFPNADRQRFSSSDVSSITSAKGPVQRRMEMDSKTREECEEAPKRTPGRPPNNKLARMPNSSVPPLGVPLIRDPRARSSLELREDDRSQLPPNLSGSFSFSRQNKNYPQNKARPPRVSIGGAPFQVQPVPVDLEVTYRCHQCDRHRRRGYRHQCRPVPKQSSSIDRDGDLPNQPPCGSVPLLLPVSAKVMLADAMPQQCPDRTVHHRFPVKHPVLRSLLTQEFLAAEAEGQREMKELQKHQTEEIMELDVAQESEVTPSADATSHLLKRLPEENASSRPQKKRQKRAKRAKRPSRANSYSKPAESLWSRDKLYTCEEIETMDILSDNDCSAAGNSEAGCPTNEKYIDVVNLSSEVSEEEEDISRERERAYGTTNVSSNDDEDSVSMGVSPSFKMSLRRRRITNSTIHSYNTRFGRKSEGEYKNDDMFDSNWDSDSKRNVPHCPTSPTFEQETRVSAPKSIKRGRGRPRKHRAMTSTGTMAASARKVSENRCGTNVEYDDEPDPEVTVHHRRTRRFRDGIPWFVAEKRAKQLSKENNIDLDVCRVLCKDIVCKLEIDESRTKKRTGSRKSSKSSLKPRPVKCHPTEIEPVCVTSDSKYMYSDSDVESCETSDDSDDAHFESDYRFHSNTPGAGVRTDEPPMHDCIIDSTADEDDSEISAGGFPAYPASARVVAEPLYPYEPDLSEPEPDPVTHCVSGDSGIGSEQLNLSNVSTTVDGDISLVNGRSDALSTSVVVISVVESVQLRVREPRSVELQDEEMPRPSAIEASEVPQVPDSDERDLPSSSSAVEEFEPQLNAEVQEGSTVLITDEDESVAPSDDVTPSNVPHFNGVQNYEVDSEMSNLVEDVSDVVTNVVERASELEYGNAQILENEKESEEHGGDEALVVEQQTEPARQCTVQSTTAVEAEGEDDDIIWDWEAPLQCSKIQATSTSTANENNEDDDIIWEAPTQTQVRSKIQPTSNTNEDDDDDIIWEEPDFIRKRNTDVTHPKRRRAKSCSVKKKKNASVLPVLAACRLVPLQYTRSIVDKAVVQSRKLADYLTNRAYEIANWLNDWKSTHEPARLVNTTAVADAVLKYWSHVSVTAPFLSDWQRLERETREDSLEKCAGVDRLYASMLFDPSKWSVLYAEWKQRLQLERLPYFDEYGIPTVTGVAPEFGNYVTRTQGSSEFPDLDSLYRWSILFTDVRKARAEDIRYRDEAMLYCPCNASFLSRILVLARYKIPPMDYFMRCELVYLLATSLSRAKKCFLHSSIRNQMKTCDDSVCTTKQKGIYSASIDTGEHKRRSRRSKSVEPDFVKEYEEMEFSDIERTLSAKRYEMKCALTKLECERQRNGNLFRRSHEPEPPRRVRTSIPTRRKRGKVDVNPMEQCAKKGNYGSTK